MSKERISRKTEEVRTMHGIVSASFIHLVNKRCVMRPYVCTSVRLPNFLMDLDDIRHSEINLYFVN